MRAFALGLLLAAPAAAQIAPAPTPTATLTPAQEVRVRLTTSAGDVVIAVDKTHAPITAANFLKYVDGKKLDGIAFYRSVKSGEGYGLVQFGTRNDPKRTLPPIAFEPTSKTELSHVDGAISMAMNKPGSAAGDFFIVIGNITPMDAKPGDPGFAVFGRVVEGMDLVRRIRDYPTSPTLGAGVMRGQMLSPTLKIVSARRVP